MVDGERGYCRSGFLQIINVNVGSIIHLFGAACVSILFSLVMMAMVLVQLRFTFKK